MNIIKATEKTYWINGDNYGVLEVGNELATKTKPFSTTDKSEWLQKLGVSSENELEDNEASELEAHKIQNLKDRLIDKAKFNVANKLSSTDYKVIRHRDQQALKVETSLSEVEYQTLLKERNDLRIKSNELEATIKAKRSIKTLNEIKIEF